MWPLSNLLPIMSLVEYVGARFAVRGMSLHRTVAGVMQTLPLHVDLDNVAPSRPSPS